VKQIILYWIVIALIGILMFPAFQGNAQSNSNQLIFDTLIIYEHYGILMCIDTVNDDTAFYTADGVTGKYADLDSAYIDTIKGYLKGKADSALSADSAYWADLLDGYNEDYFLDTNDVIRDSSWTSAFVDIINSKDSTDIEFTDDVVFDSTLTIKRGSFETLIFNTSGYAQWRPTPANGASEQIVTDARFIPPIALYDSLLFDSIKVGIFTWGNDSIRLDSVEMAIGHLDGTSANTFRFDANGFKIGYYVTGDTIIALSTGNGKYELGNDFFSTMSWFMYNWDAAPSAVQLYPILVFGHYFYK